MNDTFDADLTSGIAAFDSKNFSMAYQLLSPLADAGNSESQWRIGMMQMNGLGMVGNQKLAFENFMKAAKKRASICTSHDSCCIHVGGGG